MVVEVATPIASLIPTGWSGCIDTPRLDPESRLHVKRDRADTSVDLERLDMQQYQLSPTPFSRSWGPSNLRESSMVVLDGPALTIPI